MNKKHNQRYRDMDLCMKAAMLRLMQDTPFDKITVTSICRKAGVNRSTFYAHYPDIRSMMEQIEDHLNDELIQITEAWTRASRPDGGAESPFIPYLCYVKEHQYFYRMALSSRKALPIRKSFEPLWRQIIRPYRARMELPAEEELYYFIYFQAGVGMVLKYWIETGCRESEDKLAAVLARCVPAGLFLPQAGPSSP